VSYVQAHILDPLGMNRSTFRQPLPDDLAPLLARTYRPWPLPQLAFFHTIPAPIGALSSTGADMGRFMRALINGGELDGVRILAKARLDEMMAPGLATPAGYLGLVFMGTKVAGHDSIGHDGDTTTFFSELKIFPEQGIGVFVSRSGTGEVKAASQIPDPAVAIARRFLPRMPEAADARAISLPSDPSVVGIYHASRRAESSFFRFHDLVKESVFKVDGDGNARSYSALWPFGDGAMLKRVERNLYETPNGERIAFVDDSGSEPYWAAPAVCLQRVPWSLDVRWIAPAFLVSAGVILLTLLAWPVAALWRYWRKKRWSEDSGDLRIHLAVRLVLLVDAAVIVASAVLFIMGMTDLTRFNDAEDPLLLALYAFAWLGVSGAVLALWAATRFWRNGVGSRWSRIHHCLIAASSVTIAWFFVVFRIAGTSLIY